MTQTPCSAILPAVVLVLTTASFSWAQNTRIDSFEVAKKLAPQISADHLEEFYCGCRFSGTQVDLASCGYQPKRYVRRATRLEWEHVVPAGAFGPAFPEWWEGPPSCVDRKGQVLQRPELRQENSHAVSVHGG